MICKYLPRWWGADAKAAAKQYEEEFGVRDLIACTIPPFIVWAIGFHIFKINPAVLMGGVAGARSHSGPCREAAVEIQSSVPWIGFPVGYAVSGILLTVFGYFAMLLAQ